MSQGILALLCALVRRVLKGKRKPNLLLERCCRSSVVAGRSGIGQCEKRNSPLMQGEILCGVNHENTNRDSRRATMDDMHALVA